MFLYRLNMNHDRPIFVEKQGFLSTSIISLYNQQLKPLKTGLDLFFRYFICFSNPSPQTRPEFF